MNLIERTQEKFTKNPKLSILNSLAVMGVVNPLLSLASLILYVCLEEDFNGEEISLINRVFKFWLLITVIGLFITMLFFVSLQVQIFNQLPLILVSVVPFLTVILSWSTVVFGILNFILFLKEKSTIYPELKFFKLDVHAMIEKLFLNTKSQNI